MAKKNPFLEAFEAKMEANYKQRLEASAEFDRIAFMQTVHEELGVGPGRAGRVFNAYMANKRKLPEMIREDYGPDKDTGDKEILHTKKSVARFLKRVFSPGDWEKVKIWFPLVRDYW